MSALHALVVDDDSETREVLSELLRQEACSVHTVRTGREAIAHFSNGADLVMLGDPLPDGDGLEVMRRLREIDPCCPIMLMASSGGVKHAVTALQLGATDYTEKPIAADAVGRFLREAVARAGAPTGTPRSGIGTLLGASSAMRRVRSLLRRALESPTAPVLLLGETGTGKALAARALHEDDAEAQGPFLTLACTGLPRDALEAELFGEAGNPGGEGLLRRAQGGTLHIHDVDHLPSEVQGKLVAALDEGIFRPVGGAAEHDLDVRLVASTSCDLRQAVRQRQFRSDLYYRLAVFVVEMPPLRERPGDTELLARRFVLEISRRELRPTPLLSADAIAALRGHGWPGNVRELRNVLERAILLRNEPRLHAQSFDLARDPPTPAVDLLDLPPSGLDLREFERRMVEQALRRANGNITRAARMLGLNRDQMRYRVAKFGLGR